MAITANAVPFYFRFFQVIARRLGQAQMRNLAALKAKKFYIGFRPVQKLKQYARNKLQREEEAARLQFERLQQMLQQKEKLEEALRKLLKKKNAKDNDQPFGGILAALAPH